MKIFWIELCNYRQYKDVVKIDFSTKKTENFTVIEGKNGAGKTNLMNAITWCLYGIEAHLTESKNKLGIVNEKTIIDSKDGELIEAYVEITLGDDRPLYIFKRRCLAKKHEGKILTEDLSLKAWRLINDDWIELKSPEAAVRTLLPSNIHHFYFFDGEQLDDFFKSESVKNIRNAILNVSQIELLNRTITHLENVKSKVVSESRKLTPNIKSISDRKEAVSKGKINYEEKLRGKKDEKTKIEEKINVLEEKLRKSSIEIVQRIQMQRDENKKRLEKLKDEKERLIREIENILFQLGPRVLAYEAICETLKQINQKIDKGELPPKIRSIYLKELLEKKMCICGTKLEENSLARENIFRLLQETSFSEVESEIIGSKFLLEQLRSKEKLHEIINELDEKRALIATISEDIEETKEDLKQLSDTLKQYDEEEISRMEAQLIRMKNDKDKLIKEIAILEARIKTAEDELRKLDKELDDELEKENRFIELRNKRHLYQTISDILSNVKEELLIDVRKTVEKHTNNYFHNFVWKKDSFGMVTIDENYQISVQSKHGLETVGSLSAGERQVLALSFMAALRKVAGFSAPIIIDTPLGRISHEPRLNIAKNLPKYLEGIQVGLLVTDEEYTQKVKSLLKPYIGKEYKLIYNELESQTKVESYNV